MISENRQFANLTQAWLEGDHYKWRAMRMNGVDEKYCTGNAADFEKFIKWSETLPAVIGNPLYHWTHLELARYFGIFELLSPSSAKSVYDKAGAMLLAEDLSIRGMLKKMNVAIVCTTDDPADSLEYHQKLRGAMETSVYPTWRPDNVLKTDNPVNFRNYIKRLEAACNDEITNYHGLINTLDARHQFFHNLGGRASDHGMDTFCFAPFTSSKADSMFRKLMKGKTLSKEDSEIYRTAVLTELCRMNHKRGWTQQFHIGAIRNNNARMFRNIGPDTGWDSIGNSPDAFKISRFLSSLDDTDQLARTILYNINPADNALMLTMAGNFNDGTVPAKVQHGPAWWFLDQKNGIEKHLKDLSSMGLLRRFVGMVTDSRSFLSFPRHEYFRRIFCNYIGEEIEKGLIPDDSELIKPLIEGISCNNARELFRFEKQDTVQMPK